MVAQESRDYDVYLLLNTLAPEFGCPSCKNFDDYFGELASLMQPDERLQKKIHFATIELKGNRDLFLRVKVDRIPTMLYLPATTGIPSSEYPSRIKSFDSHTYGHHNHQGLIMSRPMSKETIKAFIELNSSVQLNTPSSSKLGLIMFSFGAFLIVIALAKIYLGQVLFAVLFMPKFWSVISMVRKR